MSEPDFIPCPPPDPKMVAHWKWLQNEQRKLDASMDPRARRAVTEQTCCACLEVRFDPIQNIDGTASERWRCTTSGCEFVRRPAHDLANTGRPGVSAQAFEEWWADCALWADRDGGGEEVLIVYAHPKECAEAAFAAGAESMRERAAHMIDLVAAHGRGAISAADIRALPLSPSEEPSDAP